MKKQLLPLFRHFDDDLWSFIFDARQQAGILNRALFNEMLNLKIEEAIHSRARLFASELHPAKIELIRNQLRLAFNALYDIGVCVKYVPVSDSAKKKYDCIVLSNNSNHLSYDNLNK